MNMRIANKTIENFEADKLVAIRPLKERVASALGEDFEDLYAIEKEEYSKKIRQEVETNEGDLKNSAFTFLDSMPNNSLSELGVTSTQEIEDIRALNRHNSLKDLPEKLVNYLVEITATWKALLALRDKAITWVQSNNAAEEYPEFFRR